MRAALVAGMLGLALACAGEPGPPDVAAGTGASGGVLTGGASGAGAVSAGAAGKGGGSGYGGGDEGGVSPFPNVTLAAGWEVSFVEDPPAISCSSGVESAKAGGAAFLSFGSKTLIAGYEQSGQNQDPVVALFDGTTQLWCQHHEQDAPNGRAHGLSWDGGASLYVVYSIVAGGTALDAAAKNGWLSSYGSAGGPIVVFAGRVDAGTGALEAGSYLVAKQQDGSTNGLTPFDAVLPVADGTLEVRGLSELAPLNPDKSGMTCSAAPFYARYVLSADFSTVECSSATGCEAKMPCP